jgi:hypothetical protein
MAREKDALAWLTWRAEGPNCRNWLKRRANAQRLGRPSVDQQWITQALNSGAVVSEPTVLSIPITGVVVVFLKGRAM